METSRQENKQDTSNSAGEPSKQVLQEISRSKHEIHYEGVLQQKEKKAGKYKDATPILEAVEAAGDLWSLNKEKIDPGAIPKSDQDWTKEKTQINKTYRIRRLLNPHRCTWIR